MALSPSLFLPQGGPAADTAFLFLNFPAFIPGGPLKTWPAPHSVLELPHLLLYCPGAVLLPYPPPTTPVKQRLQAVEYKDQERPSNQIPGTLRSSRAIIYYVYGFQSDALEFFSGTLEASKGKERWKEQAKAEVPHLPLLYSNPPVCLVYTQVRFHLRRKKQTNTISRLLKKSIYVSLGKCICSYFPKVTNSSLFTWDCPSFSTENSVFISPDNATPLSCLPSRGVISHP